MRVAAVDCGTNSLRLLIADVDPATGALDDVVRDLVVVRLGKDVDRTARIDPERMAAALSVCRDYAARCRAHRVEVVRFVATSAARDAANAADFVAGVAEAFAEFAVVPEVIGGEEEARLGFAGTTASLRCAGWPAPYLVIDIGGGSTEFVRGGDEVDAAISLSLGSVRLTERHRLDAEPPATADLAAARAEVADAVSSANASVGFAGVATVVGVAGTVTTISAHALARRGTAGITPKGTHLVRLAPEAVLAAADDLVTMTRAQRAALPYLHPGRVDVIAGGALIWAEVVAAVLGGNPEIAVLASTNDILDGIALGFLA